MTTQHQEKEKMILRLLEASGAVVRDNHFVYKSENHGPDYVNKDAVYRDPVAVKTLCLMVARQFVDDNIDVVAAPAVGGVQLSTWTAYHLGGLGGDRKVVSIYADKKGKDDFEIRRGYDKELAGKRVLVVEDLVTTGGSVRKVVNEVRTHGGIVVGVAALVNRGGVTTEAVGSPERFISLLNIPEMKMYPPDECPLCRDGVPVNTNLGHGAEFLAKQKK